MKRPVWLQELEEEMSRDRTYVVVGFVVFACGLGIVGWKYREKARSTTGS